MLFTMKCVYPQVVRGTLLIIDAIRTLFMESTVAARGKETPDVDQESVKCF
jgi:hypothetical protein